MSYSEIHRKYSVHLKNTTFPYPIRIFFLLFPPLIKIVLLTYNIFIRTILDVI